MIWVACNLFVNEQVELCMLQQTECKWKVCVCDVVEIGSSVTMILLIVTWWRLVAV
jgi:hypothetical protein